MNFFALFASSWDPSFKEKFLSFVRRLHTVVFILWCLGFAVDSFKVFARYAASWEEGRRIDSIDPYTDPSRNLFYNQEEGLVRLILDKDKDYFYEIVSNDPRLLDGTYAAQGYQDPTPNDIIRYKKAYGSIGKAKKTFFDILNYLPYFLLFPLISAILCFIFTGHFRFVLDFGSMGKKSSFPG